MEAIKSLKNKFGDSDLFGVEKDASHVALTLMIAESHTEEMDTMVKVVVSLINRKNLFPRLRDFVGLRPPTSLGQGSCKA